MANLSLVFDILARDNASGPFKNVGNAAERAGGQTSKFGTAMSSAMKLAGGALLGAGLVEGFKALYTAADESRKIGALTGAVLKSTGGAAGVTAKQVGDLAAAIAKKTGVDDEAIQSGENLLLTFTNIKNVAGDGNDIFSQTTKIMTDMSVALGKDASSSAIMLGKALNDPVKGLTALSKAGVSFTAQQKEQIKAMVAAGDTLGAQKIILAELGKEFGGAAEAASTPLGKLQQRLGDLAEQLGGYLIPAVDKAATLFSDKLMPVLSDVGAMANAVVVPAFQGAATVIGALADTFNALPGPLQIAAVAAAGWAVAGDRIMGGLGKLRGALSPLGGTVSAFGEALGYARANGDGLGTVLRSVGSYAGGQTLAAIKALGRAIGPELAVAAGAFVITEFVSGLRLLTSASDEATSAAEGVAHSLTLIDEAADRQTMRDAIEGIDGLVEALDGAGVSSQDAVNGLLGQEDATKRVTRAIETYMATKVSGYAGGDAAEVRQALNDYKELAGGYGTAASNARYFSDEAPGATAAAQATGAAAEESVPKIDVAAEAVKKWREQLQNVGASFVEPLAIYKDLLQQAAQATADSTKSSKDSWSDYADSSSVSLDKFAQKLQDQITAQENWRTNLVTIAARGGQEVAGILADMGVEGAGYVQQLVDSNGEDFIKMRDLMIKDARQGSEGVAATLDVNMKNAARIGRAGAKDTAFGIAQELGIGVGQVQAIAAQYGVKLALGINPVLGALGRSKIDVARYRAKAEFSSGGYTGDGGKYTPAGIVHAGEFVFPQEAVKRIGVDFLGAMAGLPGYAGGGFVSADSVPRPPSTSPYRAPISTAGDATMQKGFDEVRRWLEANQEPAYTGGSASASPSALVAFGHWLQRMGARVSEHPAFGGVHPVHVKGSKHYSGRAIDVNTRPGTSALEQRELDPLMAAARAAGFQVIWRAAGHFNHGHVASYGDGTNYVPETGMAMVHKGEAIVPVSHNQGAPFAGGPVEITGTLRIDGDGLARIVDGRIVGALVGVTDRGSYNG